MRCPVRDKMNSSKTPDIVSGENVDTMIGHCQWEVSTDFLGHSTCVSFIFVEEIQFSPATSGKPGNAHGNQSDQLHEEISHCTGHRKSTTQPWKLGEGTAPKTLKHTDLQTPQPVPDLFNIACKRCTI